MKKTMTMGAILIALMTAISCSETETGIDPAPDGGDGQVALGINPNLKVEGTKAVTKSVIIGEKITYQAGQFTNSDSVPGLGVVVTKSGATGWYTPDEANGGYTGHHIWYMGNEKGENWISIDTKGSKYADTKEKPYYLTKEVGQVYAYYPYDKEALSNLLNISSASDLKIPVTVLTTGEIDATTNNAKKYWNENQWSSTSKQNLVNLALPKEKDYLYFAGTEGRYVNNGRADNQPPVDPEADPTNNNTNNPGYKINLDMKHAMAMVSFRVYDGGHLSSNDVKFMKFEIKNHNGGSSPFKTGSAKMSLTDGEITGASATDAMSRTIKNYILMRQIESGAEGEHAFIQTGTSTSSVNGQSVSKTVSAIVYPTTFQDNEIDVVVTLQEGANTAVTYTVILPAHEWTAATNCIYTFSAGRNKLTVVSVLVEDWEEDPQDEIPL